MNLVIVEDDINMRKSLEIALGEYEEFQIKSYKSATEALKKIDSDTDLIITDIAMPIMDGLDMAKEIKEIANDVPIVVLSAYSEKERLLRSIDIGIDKYLIKPVDVDELFKVLDYLVGEKIETNALVDISKEYQFNKTKRILIHKGQEIV
ncbi:response regulator transcription factor, partial [Escherichia coli]|nr:response regulator transcription factor [Escherichia coli]